MFVNDDVMQMWAQISVGSAEVAISCNEFFVRLVQVAFRSADWEVKLLQHSINAQVDAGSIGDRGW